MTIRKAFITQLLLLLCCFSLTAKTSDGNPYIQNFDSDTYGAHNRNFDVVADEYGNVFFANFEGLLYYDGSQFRTLYTPGISRLTKLLKEDNGKIWIGGYNVVGYLMSGENARLTMKILVSDKKGQKIGEVTDIAPIEGQVEITTLKGDKYRWANSRLVKLNTKADTDIEPQMTADGVKINHILQLPTGEKLLATAGGGVRCIDGSGQEVFRLNHANGLCDDNVNKLAYNGHGRVWGATDNGIFCLAYPTAFTHISQNEGIPGEVLSIQEYEGNEYVGTTQGLFVSSSEGYKQVGDIKEACWQLAPDGTRGMYAATASGLALVKGSASRHLTHQHTLAVRPMGNGTCVAAQLKDVVEVSPSGEVKVIADYDNVTKIMEPPTRDALFLQDVYGSVYVRSAGENTFERINNLIDLPDDAIMNMFDGNGSLDIIHNGNIYMWDKDKRKYLKVDSLTGNYQYPNFVYTDENNYIWFTDNEGKNITPFYKRKVYEEYVPWLQNFDDEKVSAMYVHGDNVLFGSSKGIVNWNLKAQDPSFDVKPAVYLRCVKLGNDSILWGGFEGEQTYVPRTNLADVNLPSRHSALQIFFSTAMQTVFGSVEYRYRLNDGNWTDWQRKKSVSYSSLASGSYLFQVQARDAFGRISPPATVSFYVAYPWYLKWWSILLYIALLATLVAWAIKWKTQRLQKDKIKLQKAVDDATAKLIEENKKTLASEKRAARLETQRDMAMGLADRIKNPVNYVINFSSNSVRFVDEMLEYIEDEKDNISEESYDELADLTDMLKTNLQKVADHGTGISKIISAVNNIAETGEGEVGKMEPADIAQVCRTQMESIYRNYEQDIQATGLKTEVKGCDTPVIITCDATKLASCISSMIGNSIFAVKKKFEKQKYEPLIRLTLDTDDDNVYIRLYDNGIGIEEKNLSEVFKIFFSTKSTAEAPGVGLYLTRKIVRDHGGDIKVESKQNEYTEFTITLKKR